MRVASLLCRGLCRFDGNHMFPGIAEIEQIIEALPLNKPKGIDFGLFGIVCVFSGKRIVFKHKGVGVFKRVTPPRAATAARLRKIEGVEVAIVTVKGLENSLVQLSQGMIAADGDTPLNTFVTGQGNFEDVHLFLCGLCHKNFPDSGCGFAQS